MSFKNALSKNTNSQVKSQNRPGMTSGAPNTNDDFCIEENLERMRSDDKYDECNFRDRPSRNPSVSGLLEKNPKQEQNLFICSKVTPLGDDQIDIEDNNDKIESEGLNNSKGENASSNDEMKDSKPVKPKQTQAGKSLGKGKTGILDLGMLKMAVEEEVEEELKIPFLVFRYSSKWIRRWLLLIMFAATYNGFMVPYFIAFEPKYEFAEGYDHVNIIIDLIFILDIFVRIRTTFMDEILSQEIVDPKVLAKRYIKSQFLIDFLSAIPLDYFAYCVSGDSAEILMYLGAMRLFRIFKMSDIASLINLPDFLKHFVRLIKLVFALTLYIHCSACCWFIILSTKNDWMPPLDFVWVKTDFYQKSQFFKYSTCVYRDLKLPLTHFLLICFN